MDFGDPSTYVGLGPLGIGFAMLFRDNIRLRSENKDLRDAERRAAAAEAKVAGLEVKLADALERITVLEQRLDEGGVGHA